MNNTPLNALIVGAGAIGARHDQPGDSGVLTHAHAFSVSPHFILAGFVDTDVQRREDAARRWSVDAFESLDKAFAGGSVDVVSITVPDEAHAGVLEALLEYPIRLVFCEKPLATRSKTARDIVEAYRSRGIRLAVNYTRRYVPEFTGVRDAIQGGLYGAFLNGRALYGKGVLHNGSHLLDLAMAFLGPLSVEAITGSLSDYHAGDPSLSALLRTRTGQPFHLEAVSCKHMTLAELDLLFERGRLRLSDCARRYELWRTGPDPMVPGYQGLIPQEPPPSGYPQALLHAVNSLACHLQEGTPLPVMADEALEVLALCEALVEKAGALKVL